jgi:hypothetical protein
MFHMTATRADGHGVIVKSDDSVAVLLPYAIRVMQERGWHGAMVRIANGMGEEVFNAYVPAHLPPAEA